jgi:glycosyltransferase involved in cell wall biosynthesis
MRILSLIDAISGGGAMVMFNVIKGLPQYEHLVVCPTRYDSYSIGLPKMFRDAKIEIHCVPAVHNRTAMRQIETEVMKFDPDIILNHWWRSSRIQRLNKFGKTRKVYGRARTILVSHNNDPSPPGYQFYISVSKHSSRFQKYAKRENHEVIYNGIDIERFDVPKEDIKGKFVIGRVSSLAKFKIPQDWISFANSFKIPNQMHMIVGGGERQRCLEADIRRLGAQDRFVLPGEVSNEALPQMLAKFDIMVYITEKSEAFSLAILEAMAAGIPIVTQNMGGNSEQVIHGKTGFLVNSRREIKYYTELLSRSPDLVRALGQGAKERAKQFTIEKMCRQYDSLFRKLIK